MAEPQMPSLQIVAEQFRAELFAYIRSKVGDPATADDLTHETFVKVSRALAKGTTPEHFRGWLYQIARNTTIDFITESRRFVPLCLWKIRLSTARRVTRRVMIPVITNFASSSSPNKCFLNER
jgi:RNA polymerase sigma factor (sigma-70 family)